MSESNLLLFQHWERTLSDLLDRTTKFPKAVRFTFTTRIDNLALDVLEAIVAARYTTGRARRSRLEELDGKLTRLRVLLRLCHERGLLSPGGYELTSRNVDEAGRMVGGWLKASAGQRASSSDVG